MVGSAWSTDTGYRRSGLGAVLALKPLAEAKSRLALSPALRARLALSMFLDTVIAVSGVAERIVVISDEPALQSRISRLGSDAVVLAEDEPTGLNAALRQGAQWLAGRGAGRVFACLGDLPALSVAELDRVMSAADRHERAFLADTDGTGTTMLITDRGHFDPRFGPGSAAAHAAAGVHSLRREDLDAPVPTARRDVDTAEDLRQAASLGLGAWTGSLIDPATGEPGRLQRITVAQHREPRDDRLGSVGTGYPVITGSGQRIWLPDAAVQDHDRGRESRLRPGQSLHAVTADGRVLAAWL